MEEGELKKAPIYEAKFTKNEIIGFIKIQFISVEFDYVVLPSEEEAMAMRYIMAKKFGTVTNLEKLDAKKYACKLLTDDLQLRRCKDGLIGVYTYGPLFRIIEI